MGSISLLKMGYVSDFTLLSFNVKRNVSLLRLGSLMKFHSYKKRMTWIGNRLNVQCSDLAQTSLYADEKQRPNRLGSSF